MPVWVILLIVAIIVGAIIGAMSNEENKGAGFLMGGITAAGGCLYLLFQLIMYLLPFLLLALLFKTCS